ncbi:hypothetical protein Angca_003367 [Angiostrongylus cantonensis]|nr:hypothetical protein Angca_003367 [Angiostrongylus cantonensis]
MLDNENQRLMRVQNELITDANRRVEMHVNEIRMLKEENKKLVAANKELRELCCFLDDDRQKTRRLAKEWQKFGRYTSQVMKQEMSMNQQRLRESEERHMEAIRENEELKQLCLYLDEQRQRFTNYRAEDDRESEDLGCGSSERSEDCDDSKYTCDIPGINPQKEDTLRLISQRMESSVVSVHSVANEQSVRSEQLLDYIHSLEGRIKQLEKASQQNGIWHSACTLESESDEKTVIDRCDEFSNGVIIANGSPRDPKAMQTSYCSTLTTSGTTYASSETDMESAVYVMGDETDGIESLQVRSLARIEEEDKDKSLDEVEEESAKLPPTIAPLSLLNVARLSLTNSELSLSLNRSFEESQPRRCSSSSAVPIAAPLVRSPRRHRIAWKNTVFGVVKVPFNRGSNTEETGITAVRDSCSNRCGITAV